MAEGRTPFAQIGYSGASDDFTLTTGGTPEAVGTTTGVAVTSTVAPSDPIDRELFTLDLAAGTIKCNFAGVVEVIARIEGDAADNASHVEMVFAGASGSQTATGKRDEDDAFIEDGAADNVEIRLGVQALLRVAKNDLIDVRLDSDTSADTFGVREFEFYVKALTVENR